MKASTWGSALVALLACQLATAGAPEQALTIKPLAERTVSSLPAGVLYWRVENFGSASEAEAAAGPWSLVVESTGKTWLFTLGAPGGSTPGGVKVAEVGPIPRIDAQRYLLRVNEASGPPGSKTSVHSHPGSEAFLVLQGEQSIQGADRLVRVEAGHAEAGLGADRAMKVSSSGSTDLRALVMFVVDASKPFSSPASLPGAPTAQ